MQCSHLGRMPSCLLKQYNECTSEVQSSRAPQAKISTETEAVEHLHGWNEERIPDFLMKQQQQRKNVFSSTCCPMG